MFAYEFIGKLSDDSKWLVCIEQKNLPKSIYHEIFDIPSPKMVCSNPFRLVVTVRMCVFCRIRKQTGRPTNRNNFVCDENNSTHLPFRLLSATIDIDTLVLVSFAAQHHSSSMWLSENWFGKPHRISFKWLQVTIESGTISKPIVFFLLLHASVSLLYSIATLCYIDFVCTE